MVVAGLRYRCSAPQSCARTLHAETIGKSPKTLYGWSAQHEWADRAESWDADQDQVARQARLDAIERFSRHDVEVADAMLTLVEQHLQEAARALDKSPCALGEWVKTATKLRRDALGIADSDQPANQALDNDARQKDNEVTDAMAHLPPAMVLQLQAISLEMTRLKCQRRIGMLPAAPVVPAPHGPSFGPSL
jgi:hypothetical protein